MNLEYRDKNGRKVSQRQWLNGLENDVFEQAERAVEDQLRNVRCSEHGQGIRNLQGRRESGGLRYSWEACCEKLNSAVERPLR